MNRPLSANEHAFQDRTIEVEQKGQEAVVSKQAQVTEEVVVNKDVQQRNQKVSDTVRRTEVEVEDERVQKVVPLRLAAEDSSKQNEPHQLHAKRTPAA